MKEIIIQTTGNEHEVLFHLKSRHGFSAKDLLLKGAFDTGLIFRCEMCGKVYFHGDDYGEQTSDGCDICNNCHPEWLASQV